jgi:tRNA U34 5-methylaminomethyl-2-thiouridine-forming methyltransferase MnmC
MPRSFAMMDNAHDELSVQTELTADGSMTVRDLRTGSTYHSRHGARAESMHVFIEAGLRHLMAQGRTGIRILEMGLGTGLNVLLTAQEQGCTVHYTALEAHPLPQPVWEQLVANEEGNRELLTVIHAAPWGEPVPITPHFSLEKKNVRLQDFSPDAPFDLIYFDAFEPGTQPELWTEEVFAALFRMTEPGGVLTTYCAKGAVRRAMQTAGYIVERLPGPPFKREMLRAVRTT